MRRMPTHRRTFSWPNAHRRSTKHNWLRFESLEPKRVLAAAPVITEFMADNESTLEDGDGATSDWIEIRNAGDETVDLAGWHLTDDPNTLDRWTFPDGRSDLTQLEAGQHLIVFASGTHLDASGNAVDPYLDHEGNLHANFRISKNGEYLALIGPSGVASEFGTAETDFPPQLPDVSFGQNAEGNYEFYATPTPGEVNGSGFESIVTETVAFNESSHSFRDAFELILSSTIDAPIHYTLDGRVPDATSAVYDTPIMVDSTVQVRARVVAPNQGPGPVRSESYLHLEDEVATFTSPLPIVVIENFAAGEIPNKRDGESLAGNGSGIKQVAHQPVHLALFDRADGVASVNQSISLATRAGIRVHGGSSATPQAVRKSINVETWGESNDDDAVEILGMPRESDWVLYAPSPEFDRSLLHNTVMHELSQQMGRDTVRFRFVEAFINTDGGSLSMDDHAGLYVLMEKIKRDANRVDFEPLSSDGQTGGWIVQSDRYQAIPIGETEHPPTFQPRGASNLFVFESPHGKDINEAQINSIESWFDEFEDVLYGPDFMDPDKGYRAYIDVDSFIDHMQLTNLALSVDALRLSTYMVKRSETSKLELGPVWDFDRAFGSDRRGTDPTINLMFGHDRLWMPRLFQDPDFEQQWQDRWHELRQGPFAIENIYDVIDEQVAEITEEVALANGTAAWPTKIQAMKDWIAQRVEAIDGQYLDLPRFLPGQHALPGSTAELLAVEGTAYYTTDGTDPRVSGGAVSPIAQSVPGGVDFASVLVAEDAPASAIVPTEAFDAEFGISWNGQDPNFDDSTEAGWKQGTMGAGFDENTTYRPFIGLNLLRDMLDVNATLYARMEFQVDTTAFDFMQLKMRFDDGFIAYLNGTEITSDNAPTDPTWNSAALRSRRDADAVEFEIFDVSAHLDLLHEGENVLAIHGMNWRSSGNDMLVQAELIAGQFARTVLDVHHGDLIIARSYEDGVWSGPSLLEAARPGDANGDGVFNAEDLTLAFIGGKYNDEIPDNATFAEGDWNGDGDFDEQDIVAAFIEGHYQTEPALKNSALAAAIDAAFEE